MYKNIVLIGLMGSGKTATGKLIAQKTSMNFVDSDELIVEKAGKSINKIFQEDGESCFREIEAEVIKNAAQKSGCVISTGGGAVLRLENLRNLKETGILFYLEAPAEVLWQRIRECSSRPLLNKDNPVEILQNLINVRKSFYETADFTIHTENTPVEEVAEQVLDAYNKYWP